MQKKTIALKIGFRGDIRDQSLKLSEIALSIAPANFKGAGPKKICT